MSFDYQALEDAAVSAALTLGLFDKVQGHEPKNAPGHGLTAAVWAQEIRPIQAGGLAATSGRVELATRVYTNMLREPQDAIDPAVLKAADALMAAYSGNFDLDIAGVRCVDLLGMYGDPLSARAGYLNQDGKLYRVMTVTVPVIVNDLWVQVA